MKKISRNLKREINKTAHAEGVEHAKKVRAALIADALAGLPTFAEAFPDIPSCAEAFPNFPTFAEEFPDVGGISD